MNYTPKGDGRDKRMRGHHNMIGQQDDVIIIIVIVWLLGQLSSGRLVAARVVKASGGRVQDRLLHDNRDKVVVIVPRWGCRPTPDAVLNVTMGAGYRT